MPDLRMIAMKSAIVALAAVLAVSLAFGQRKSASHDPVSYWKNNPALELGPDDQLKVANELSEEQREALLRAVASTLRPAMKELGLTSEGELLKTAAEARIKLVDLSAGPQREVIAQASDEANCGATGNCSLWVFKRTAQGYVLILSEVAQDVTILPTSTNGFHDLMLGIHGSATEQELDLFRFVNGHYQRGACFDANWLKRDGDPVVTPCVVLTKK